MSHENEDKRRQWFLAEFQRIVNMSDSGDSSPYQSHTDFNRTSNQDLNKTQRQQRFYDAFQRICDMPDDDEEEEASQVPHRFPVANNEDKTGVDRHEYGKHQENANQDDETRRRKFLEAFQRIVNMGDPDVDECLHHEQCAACQTSPLRKDRYHCLECPGNYDLCGPCFERRCQTKQHVSGHLLAHFKMPNEIFGRSVRSGALTLSDTFNMFKDDSHANTCDGCRQKGFKGLRFKCDICSDFDLCQSCARNHVLSRGHSHDHPLILASDKAMPEINVNDIKCGQVLGRGGFGYVCEARWISKQRDVACKVIEISGASQKSLQLEQSFLKELAAYRELCGSYILKTFGYAAERYQGAHGQGVKYMIIMELMARGSLAKVIEEDHTLSLYRKLTMSRHVAAGMRRIHQHGMLHRDIRPDNILVDSDYIAKIGDMGIARFLNPSGAHTQVGCLMYMPPEFYRGSFDQKLDIYTFGLTIYHLFTGFPHDFQSHTQPIKFNKQIPVFSDIIMRCCDSVTHKRPSALELEKTLELYEYGFSELVIKKQHSYDNLSLQQKNQTFIQFCQSFQAEVDKFIALNNFL